MHWKKYPCRRHTFATRCRLSSRLVSHVSTYLNKGNNFRATRRQTASPIKTNYQYQTCHLGYKQCINTKQHAKVCRGLAFMVDFVKIRLLLIKTILCCRLLGKQLLRMRCSCSKTRSGTEFSANTIFKGSITIKMYFNKKNCRYCAR